MTPRAITTTASKTLEASESEDPNLSDLDEDEDVIGMLLNGEESKLKRSFGAKLTRNSSKLKLKSKNSKRKRMM